MRRALGVVNSVRGGGTMYREGRGYVLGEQPEKNMFLADIASLELCTHWTDPRSQIRDLDVFGADLHGLKLMLPGGSRICCMI